MIKAITKHLALTALLALPLATAVAQPTLDNLEAFAADGSGNYTSGFAADTQPGFNFNIWLRSGATFLNGPTDAAVQPSVSLGVGTHTYQMFIDPGTDQPYFGLNLYFNGSTGPGISVYGPMLAAIGSHTFSANSSANTLNWPPNSQGPGAGTLSFTSGGYNVTLTDFYLAAQNVFNQDLAGSSTLGADGFTDYVGGFSLEVTAVPEPSVSLWMAGLAITAVAGYRKTRKN